MTSTTSSPTVILIAGHWLGAWAWDEVRAHLTAGGVRAIAMTLPGLDGHDPERVTKTLDDQAAAIRDTVVQHKSSEDQPVILVAHSGANAPVSLVLDGNPDLVCQPRRVGRLRSGATGKHLRARSPGGCG